MTTDIDPQVTAVAPLSPAERTAGFVRGVIEPIQRQYIGGGQPTSYSRAVLSRLRRGVGKPVGALPDLLEFVVDPEDRRRSDDATREEIAAYTALTLYAVHQQSRTKAPMHVRKTSFASAVGAMRRRPSGDDDEGVMRRFQALGTASTIEELTQHARGLVTLLRGAERGVDYGRFASDLVRFQNPRTADSVRLEWGRDFYRVRPAAAEGATTTEEQS